MTERTSRRRILCYGDSNTYGYDPRDGGRYDARHRWPDVLARTLGGGYEILPCGMNGREIDVSEPPAQDISGLVYTRTLARSMPLDGLILMLGSNNIASGAGGEKIASGMRRMIRQAEEAAEKSGRALRILVIGPPEVLDGGGFPYPYLERQRAVSRALPGLYRDIAREEGCAFLDANGVTRACPWDGEHLGPDGHVLLGRAAAESVLRMFEEAPCPAPGRGQRQDRQE